MEWERDGERWRSIHEVYYNDDGSLGGYTEKPANPVAYDDEDIGVVLDMMREALAKPTLIAEQFEGVDETSQ